MANLSRITCTCILFALLCTGCNRNGISLQFRPQPGSQYELEYHIAGDMGVSILGKKQMAPIDTRLVTQISFDSMSPDNTALTLVYQEYKLPAADQQLLAQSKKDEKDSANLNVSDLIKGLTYTGIVDRRGKCTLQPSDTLGNRLKRTFENEQDDEIPPLIREKIIQGIELFAGHGMIEGMLDQCFYNLPGKKVSVGDKWHHQSAMQVYLSMIIDNEYELISIVDGIAEVRIESTISPASDAIVMPGMGFAAPPVMAEKGKPSTFDILGMLLKVSFAGTQSGTLFINTNTGLVRDSKIEQKLTGSVEAGAFSLPMEFNLRAGFTLKPLATTALLQ